MDYLGFCLVLLIFLPGVSCAFNHKVVPSCSEHETVCSFMFDVRYKFSMVYNDETGYAKPIVIRNGTLLKRSAYNKEEIEHLNPKGESFFLYQIFYSLVLFLLSLNRKGDLCNFVMLN